MPITVIVRQKGTAACRLTFDGTQRVVIGRGSGSDVRLPDPSVSHRHATLQAQGADFAVIDEGSTNGTFVGAVKVAARTSRIIRSGDLVRVGAVWLELRIDRSPVTRDVAAVTRDLALALVSQAMDAIGADRTARVRVVEGRDQGATLPLAEDERIFTIGRGPDCDLVLTDSDCSREHMNVVKRAGVVLVRDLGAKNGTFIGETRITSEDALWRSAHMIRIGRTVLALEEPVNDALADIERAPDAPLSGEVVAPPTPDEVPQPKVEAPSESDSAAAAPVTPSYPQDKRPPPRRRRARWSVVDMLVMAAALMILALSLVGLVWLLHG